MIANNEPALFAANSCLSGKINFSAAAPYWYASGTLDITNDCDASQSLNDQTVSFTAQDLAGNAVKFSKLDNWWVNNGHYQISFSDGGGNAQTGTISAVDGSGQEIPATIEPHQKISFSGGFNLNQSDWNNTLAQNTLSIAGSTPPLKESGDLNVIVDTKAAGCTTTNNVCNDLYFTVTDSSGALVVKVPVPASAYGQTYSELVKGLNAKEVYTVSGSQINNTEISYQPEDRVTIQANTTSNVTINYKTNAPVVATGNATISLGNYVSAYTGNLQVQVLNAKESNAVVNTYLVKQGGSFATGDLPISDASHVYKVKLLTGIANPLKGEYYLESGLPTLKIRKNTTAALAIPMKTPGKATPTATLAISGLINGDDASLTFSDATGKYSYVNQTNQTNGKVNYLIESGLVIGMSVNASSNNYKTNPLVLTKRVTKNIVLKAQFESVIQPTPGGATVAGWPNYLAMGAVGGPNTDPVGQVNSGGDDSFGGKPVDAVFKYAGVNGNGDPGVIDPPMNALRMTTDLTNVAKVNDRASRVVIVEYTGEMSGGENFADFTNTATPNPNKQNSTYIMARHFISLAADAEALANNPVIKDGKKYYGSLIMNPDLLGAMEQNGYINSVNNQLPADAVNTAVDQALCVLTTSRSYFNTSTPNDNSGTSDYPYKNKTYSGTPLQILTAMLNDGYPAWSISASSDLYWGTAINNQIPKEDGTPGEFSQVGKWFNSCVANPSYDTTKYSHPNFAAGFDGWVQANNWLIRTFAPKSTGVTFGWQDNMWAVNSGFWLHDELSEDQIAAQYSTPVSNWLKTYAPSTIMNVGSTYAPDYFVFDRYEMDDSAAPGSATLYSARSWDNYLTSVGQVSRNFNNIPVMLWQIPGSHLPYVGETNPELFNNTPGMYIFSTAPVYFFGDNNLKPDLSNLIMGSSTTSTNSGVGNYVVAANYNCNISNCNYQQYLGLYKGYANNYDWSRNNGKLALAAANNVFAILWGGGNTTNVIKNFSNPDDHGWLASKIINYYQNPQLLTK